MLSIEQHLGGQPAHNAMYGNASFFDLDPYDLLSGSLPSTYSDGLGAIYGPTEENGIFVLKSDKAESNRIPDPLKQSQPLFQEPDTTTLLSPPPLSEPHQPSTADLDEGPLKASLPTKSDSSDFSSSSTDDSASPGCEKRPKGGKPASSKRTIFSHVQLATLERRFIQQSFLSREERQDLAASLNISERQVMVWFQNRRGRLKKRGASDTAYNPMKLNELNTQRPFPFLYGMLSSAHYQHNPVKQQDWSAYPDNVRNIAASVMKQDEAPPTEIKRTSPVNLPKVSPQESSKNSLVNDEDFPPNVTINNREQIPSGHQLRMTKLSNRTVRQAQAPYQIPSRVNSHQGYHQVQVKSSPTHCDANYDQYQQLFYNQNGMFNDLQQPHYANGCQESFQNPSHFQWDYNSQNAYQQDQMPLNYSYSHVGQVSHNNWANQQTVYQNMNTNTNELVSSVICDSST